MDTGRFPEFTDDVKSAMYDEAVSTFEYIVRQDRPVKEMLYADYTFLNKPLAKFYGVEEGREDRADKMVQGRGRGRVQPRRRAAPGLGVDDDVGAAAHEPRQARRLGAAARSSARRRRRRRPTPASLPGDDKAFDGLTLRERLTEHKRNATCADCHLRIDPLGFPLEGFDAVGRTRDKYADGKAVDVTGEFADKTTIVGTDGLLEYLQTQDKPVMTTLSKKMLGYALGRTVLASDQPLVRRHGGGRRQRLVLGSGRQDRHQPAVPQPRDQ